MVMIFLQLVEKSVIDSSHLKQKAIWYNIFISFNWSLNFDFEKNFHRYLYNFNKMLTLYLKLQINSNDVILVRDILHNYEVVSQEIFN